MDFVLLVVGLTLLAVAIPLFIVLLAVEIKRRKGKDRKYLLLFSMHTIRFIDLCVLARLVGGGVLMLISAVLWVVIGGLQASKEH